jgi:hypothetical protein
MASVCLSYNVAAVMRPGSRAIALLAVMLLGSWDIDAGEPTTASLSWTRLAGAESCIGAIPLGQAVERLLGRPTFVSTPNAGVSIEGRVEARHHAAGWVATFTVSDSAGHILGNRRIPTDEGDCHALDDKLVLAIAVMIDPNTVHARQAPLVAPALALQAGAEVTLGLTPKASAGVVLHGASRYAGPVPLRLSFRFLTGGTVESPGGTGELAAVLGGLAACPRYHVSPSLAAGACVEIEAGALIGRGQGFAENYRSTQGLMLASGAIFGELGLVGPLIVQLDTGAFVPLLRPAVSYVGSDQEEHVLFRPRVVGLRVGVALGLRWW